MGVTSGNNDNLAKGAVPSFNSYYMLDSPDYPIFNITDETDSLYTIRDTPGYTYFAWDIIIPINPVFGLYPYVNSVNVVMGWSGSYVSTWTYSRIWVYVNTLSGRTTFLDIPLTSLIPNMTTYTYAAGYDKVTNLVIHGDVAHPAYGGNTVFFGVYGVYFNRAIIDSGLRFRGSDGVTYSIGASTLGEKSILRFRKKNGITYEIPRIYNGYTMPSTYWLDGTNGEGPRLKGKDYSGSYYLRKYSA